MSDLLEAWAGVRVHSSVDSFRTARPLSFSTSVTGIKLSTINFLYTHMYMDMTYRHTHSNIMVYHNRHSLT